MANLFQATVYQIDGSPLASPISIDFPTSDIIIKEATINITAVNSAIMVFGNPSNQRSYKTYYVSESIASLVTAANILNSAVVQVTVIEIENDPLPPGGVEYAFVSDEILVTPNINNVTGVNSDIIFKDDIYSVAQTQATILGGATTSSIPGDIYTVCNIGEIIEPNDASTVFPTMVTWDVRIFRGGVILNDDDLGTGSPYYNWDASTGTATWSTPPAADEEFVIQAYKLA